jgi:hypothetical protein
MQIARRFCSASAAIALLTVFPSGSRADHPRVHLFPELHAGDSLRYAVRFVTTKKIITKSNVAVPMAPENSKIESSGLLQIGVLETSRSETHSSYLLRAYFISLDDGTVAKPFGSENQKPDVLTTTAAEKVLDFKITSDGTLAQVKGLDELSPEQLQAWQIWIARFSLLWTLPGNGLRLGEKWKSEDAEKSPSPIRGLAWQRETSYVRDEPCKPARLNSEGQIVASDFPEEKCAVLLSTATLKQTSSHKDATPEDYKLHDLKTMGSAAGTNQTITYISLKTGLVLRATEEAKQALDVTVSTVDGSNQVHYHLDADSNSETQLVSSSPQIHP